METMSLEDDEKESQWGALSAADLSITDEALAALGNSREADAGTLPEGVQPLVGWYSLGLAGEQHALEGGAAAAGLATLLQLHALLALT